MVVARPIRKGDNYYECVVRLVDNNYDTILDASACQPGMKTRWITANVPEMHEEGTGIKPFIRPSSAYFNRCKIKKIFLIAGNLSL